LIRISLAIPGLALRAGLKSLLESDPALQVVIASPHPVIGQADVLVVSDAIAPDEIRRALIESERDIALLVLGESANAARAYNRLPVLAWGAIPIDAEVEEMVAAIHALHAGLVVVFPAWLDRSVQPISGPAIDAEPLIEPLTERETEVLQYLAQGLSNRQIAIKLYISEHTVKFHVSSIYGKFGATNRAEAVRLGVQQGLVAL
jgi:DNA-binding NarL/FixJ family response regulator